ncbi:MAG: hypothetical protein BGN87_19020 [Rhizobiales bacterium 65-79]|jgi:NitT/TauT family transport system substrate-binding protein|nr:ABC transporter substrate-binding protein [Hyphomicrobiales bacterium]OJU03004.1 MAG: hypothetical protein BGN87_19020 [Rhizobiales bacterium 65-79]
MRKLNWVKMLVAAATIGLSTGFAHGEGDGLTKVTLALGWLRNGQYASILAADAMGYFKDEGIKLELIDGGPGKSPVSFVGVGKADFGIHGPTFVFSARVAPAPVDVVCIGALNQKYSYAYITLGKPSDPDPTPKDMEGKTIGIQSDGEMFLKGLAEANNLDMSTMKIRTVQGGAEPLLTGAVDFISGHIHNQTYQVELEASKPDAPANLKGKTWKALKLSDYGMDSYGDVIFTSGKMLKEKPDLVRHFLKAAARGVKLMQDDPEKVAELAAKYPGQIETLDKIRWRMPIQNSLSVSEDTRTKGFLWMRPEVWDKQMKFYHDNGQISHVIPAAEVMTNEFNPGIKSK